MTAGSTSRGPVATVGPELRSIDARALGVIAVSDWCEQTVCYAIRHQKAPVLFTRWGMLGFMILVGPRFRVNLIPAVHVLAREVPGWLRKDNDLNQVRQTLTQQKVS